MWKTISSAPQGKRLITKISDERGDRNQQILTLKDGLWWTDGPNATYVYYQPTHYKEI